MKILGGEMLNAFKKKEAVKKEKTETVSEKKEIRRTKNTEKPSIYKIILENGMEILKIVK